MVRQQMGVAKVCKDIQTDYIVGDAAVDAWVAKDWQRAVSDIDSGTRLNA